MNQEKLCIYYRLTITEEQKKSLTPLVFTEHDCLYSYTNDLGQKVEIKICESFKNFEKCEFSKF